MRLWGGTAEAPNCSMSQRGRGTADQMGLLVTGRATWGNADWYRFQPVASLSLLDKDLRWPLG